ncbi:hypothetical protein, partial [Oceaniovalibus sp. ACAM 378]|uniref:hypothetical protein n=1 Tax=Oceaniovalibus sp. ACAM 378 TaxID=2599923 RepID=UPI001CA36950
TERYNAKFAKAARRADNLHRPMNIEPDRLRDVFAFQDERLVGGVCQSCCPPISCGVSDFRIADFAFWVEPDGSCRFPVSGFA